LGDEARAGLKKFTRSMSRAWSEAERAAGLGLLAHDGKARRSARHYRAAPPPKCTQFNRTKYVLQLRRDYYWLSIRAVRSSDDVVDHYSDDWSRLIGPRKRITPSDCTSAHMGFDLQELTLGAGLTSVARVALLARRSRYSEGRVRRLAKPPQRPGRFHDLVGLRLGRLAERMFCKTVAEAVRQEKTA
jgi:hypothetical protein